MTKRVEQAIEREVEKKQKETIQQAVNEITEVLNKYGLGMQANIQIFKLPANQKVTPDPLIEEGGPILAAGNTATGDIIVPGSANDPYKDLPAGLRDAIMKPTGDSFGS